MIIILCFFIVLMFWFWSIIAVIFLVAELLTLTFGFIFITFGSLIILFLLGIDVIQDTELLYQLLIILFFAVIGFYFFYKSFKRSKDATNDAFKEDMVGVVIDSPLKKGEIGKIKWSGTICNATIGHTSKLDSIPVNSNVIIDEFKGNIAVINKTE